MNVSVLTCLDAYLTPKGSNSATIRCSSLADQGIFEHVGHKGRDSIYPNESKSRTS